MQVQSPLRLSFHLSIIILWLTFTSTIVSSFYSKLLATDTPIANHIGTIVHSMLTQEQFQRVNGTGWVLMDGRCVSSHCDDCINDSEYYKVTRLAHIPDARGLFLRGHNNNRSDPKHKGNPQNKRLGETQNDQFKSHNHTNNNVVGAQSDRGKGGITSGDSKWGGQTINVLPIISHSGGKDETRPRNLTVNIFIKINPNNQDVLIATIPTHTMQLKGLDSRLNKLKTQILDKISNIPQALMETQGISTIIEKYVETLLKQKYPIEQAP